MFITFEGIDGSGKSTQARLLADALVAEGYDVVLTREPGGSPGAEEIRRLVLEGDPDRWSAETEILLFTAARRDHLERTIQPALAQGRVVISDRFADSTRVYQGSLRDSFDGIRNINAEPDIDAVGCRRKLIDSLHEMVIGREPDLTVLIDMDPELGLARAKARKGPEERFEDMGLDLQRRMRAGFLDLAAQFSGRFRVIDGARPAGHVASDVLAIALAALGAAG
jgi:dTMP kinase